MRLVKFTVSEQMLLDVLHIPDGCRITSVRTDYRGGYNDVEFIMLIPGDTPKDDNPANPVTVTPTIHYEPEKYTLDWGLPK